MLLPLTRHFSSAENLKSFVIVEAIILLPLVAFGLGFAFSYLPVPGWAQRAAVFVAIVLVSVPYLAIFRRQN